MRILILGSQDADKMASLVTEIFTYGERGTTIEFGNLVHDSSSALFGKTKIFHIRKLSSLER